MSADTPFQNLAGGPEPKRLEAYERLRAEARACQRCPLWETGTQTVFGDGSLAARLVFVGEAPGYQEDQQGRPFVGPAGQVFNEGLAQAGIARGEVYVTNTVKHRPCIPGGRQGRNRPPKQSEVNACRVWLDQELMILRPEIIVCLGAVAAKSLLGKDFRLTQQRGQWQSTPAAPHVLATLHPSFILKQPAATRESVRETFFADLRLAAERYRSL